jgi:hypothetical protein
VIDPEDETASQMIDHLLDFAEQEKVREQDPDWRKDNLEADLRSSPLMLEKVRSDRIYAQHLYAAMCNNDFRRNDVWPILQEKTWSCSWRYAGGIVAHMREEGDYMDWYCSGINGMADVTDEEYSQMSREAQESYLESKASVAEGTVTDEIRNDLLTIGWLVVD